jgi:signal transduction histidine kinase
MEDAGNLAEYLLEHCPACHWIVRADRAPARRVKGRSHYGDICFVRVWGDSSVLFGRPGNELTGMSSGAVLSRETAQTWRGRFERAFEGESVTLRERHGKSAWYISVFPIPLPGAAYAGGIAREITAWTSAEQELRHTVLGALKTQDFERTMMSRFLHDSVGQNLTALGLQLDLIRMDVEHAAPRIGARVAEIQHVLGEMMEKVREYSYALNPATVERAGLRTALDRLAVRTRGRFTGTLRVNVDPSVKIEPRLASAFYQIAQEAVENAVQHAACSSIDISLRIGRSGTVLEVRDNGRGFDPDDIVGGNRGLGLLSMEHYAAQAGLDLAIASTRGGGTTVRAATA